MTGKARSRRHPHERHAGRPEIHDGDEEVDRRRQRRDAEDLETDQPEIDVGPGGELPGGQIGIPEPAGVGRGLEQEADVEEETAQQEHPVAERVEAGKRHVARPDLQRDQEVEEHRRQRHHPEEDHGGAVHREQLVVRLRTHEPVFRTRQLPAKEQRLDAAHEEEQERRGAVENADPLVIDGRDPAPQPRLRVRRAVRVIQYRSGHVGLVAPIY